MNRRPKPRQATGDIIAERYRIDGVVGTGGFGAVYQATQLDTDRRVALKVLHSRFCTNPTDARRFQREAALVQQVTDPHIVQLLDFGQTKSGSPFIAFELLRGRALSRVLKREGPLTVDRTANIARHVLRALQAAHEFGVIHRDIKPANIFLCEQDGAYDVAKVLDFGVAKALTGEESQATQLTKDGQMVGTPNYMAPEQVRALDVGPESDLYASGLVMAEMLMGKRLVAPTEAIRAYMAQISKEPHELPDVVRNSALGPVIAQAIAKPVQARFGSARAMLKALDQAVRPDPELDDELMATVDMSPVRPSPLTPGSDDDAATRAMKVKKPPGVATQSPNAREGNAHVDLTDQPSLDEDEIKTCLMPAKAPPSSSSLERTVDMADELAEAAQIAQRESEKRGEISPGRPAAVAEQHLPAADAAPAPEGRPTPGAVQNEWSPNPPAPHLAIGAGQPGAEHAMSNLPGALAAGRATLEPTPNPDGMPPVQPGASYSYGEVYPTDHSQPYPRPRLRPQRPSRKPLGVLIVLIIVILALAALALVLWEPWATSYEGDARPPTRVGETRPFPQRTTFTHG